MCSRKTDLPSGALSYRPMRDWSIKVEAYVTRGNREKETCLRSVPLSAVYFSALLHNTSLVPTRTVPIIVFLCR
jgi:hypothetical protein